MRWRVAVAVLLTLAVGVAGGWVYASAQDDDDPDTGPVAAAIEPVPATPSLPVTVAEPDPDDATLETGIELEPTTLQLPPEGDPEYVVDLPVPKGWRRGFDDDSKWTYSVPGNSPKSYVLRVKIIAQRGQTIGSAIEARIAALQSSELQGFLSDVEYVQSGNGFTATYVDQDGYNRVSIERFYAGPGGGAFVTVAAIGRYRDRRGLEDLIAVVTTQLTTSEPTQNP